MQLLTFAEVLSNAYNIGSGFYKKQIFKTFLTTLMESIILFENKSYSQVDGVAMGPPLVPTFLDFFLCHREVTWLTKCSKNFAPKCYKRIADDFFFSKFEQLQRLSAYMNKQHLNIKCSIEATTNDILPFLDTKMYKEIGKFVTSVYREDTFSGVYTNCTSLIPLEYKFSLLDTLFRRCFCLVYDISNFHLKNIRTIFLKIVHAHKFTDKCIFKFVKTMFEHKPNVKTV